MKSIIIEPDPTQALELENMIVSSQYLRFSAKFSTTNEASEFLMQNEADLIFISIELYGREQLKFALQMSKNHLFIFTTAYPRYALDAFEINAADCLIKPLEPRRFDKAVKKARIFYHISKRQKQSSVETDKKHILVKSENSYCKINFGDILFIRGLKDYCLIHTAENAYTVHLNLKKIFTLLPSLQFIRVSRSYIIRKKAVLAFTNTKIFLENAEIPIGKNFLNGFRESMNI